MIESQKVLIGCPTSADYEYCIEDYASAIKSLSYKNFSALLIDNSSPLAQDQFIEKIKSLGLNVLKFDKNSESVKDKVVESRNSLREYFLNNDFDYLLSLEQDVIAIPNMIEKLLSHKQKIVSGIYYKQFNINLTHKGKNLGKVVKILPMLYKKIPGLDSKIGIYSAEEVQNEKLIKVRACGLGCVLIHRDVLEKIRFRFDKNSGAWDDVFFCEDAIRNGFDIYADTSVKCKHLILKKNTNILK